VQFDLGTLPTDSIVTVQDAGGDDADDSDADPATGETATTGDLVDMGIYRLASIGDTVWLDEDADGVQDAGEAGIENVVVELFNADGTPATDMNGNPMTTLTDANGNYAFDDLYPPRSHQARMIQRGMLVSIWMILLSHRHQLLYQCQMKSA